MISLLWRENLIPAGVSTEVGTVHMEILSHTLATHGYCI